MTIAHECIIRIREIGLSLSTRKTDNVVALNKKQQQKGTTPRRMLEVTKVNSISKFL